VALVEDFIFFDDFIAFEDFLAKEPVSSSANAATWIAALSTEDELNAADMLSLGGAASSIELALVEDIDDLVAFDDSMALGLSDTLTSAAFLDFPAVTPFIAEATSKMSIIAK
jgi:hypothetical protein